MKCRTSIIAESETGLVLSVGVVLIAIAGSFAVIFWAAAGVRRRRLVLSRDGQFFYEGRHAVIAGAVMIVLMVICAAMFAYVAACTIYLRGAPV